MNLGIDEIKEASEAGFVGGKLTNPISVKFNDKTMRSIERICSSRGITLADWVREVSILKLLELRRFHKSMEEVWGESTESLDSSDSKEKA